MGGDAGGTGPCRQDLCHVSPTLCPGAAAAAPTARSPYGLGPPLHLGTEIVEGMWGGWGEGQLLSLRQKDAGQHFIRNHLNVFAVFRIRALVGWVGCLGSGGRRFHLSSRLHVSVGRGVWCQQAAAVGVDDHQPRSTGCSLRGALPEPVPRKVRPMKPLLSTLPPSHLPGQG